MSTRPRSPPFWLEVSLLPVGVVTCGFAATTNLSILKTPCTRRWRGRFSERARLAYDGITPYKTYLLTIAKNLVLSELRRREVAMSQLVREVDGETAELTIDTLSGGAHPIASSEPELSAETEYLNRELARLYAAFVDQLDEQHGQFFVARFEQRKTQVEAGKAVGLSHMQSRTLEKKLRKRFLAFMQSNGYLEGYAGKAAVVPS